MAPDLPLPQRPRDRLIAAAIALMRRTGLAGAGINEIVRESGAPKGSVYHYFPDGKQQIVQEALAAYRGDVVRFIDATLARRRAPAQKVRALFDAFAERVEQGRYLHSCPAGTVCLDLDADLDALRAIVAATLAAYVDAVAVHFSALGPQRARSFAGLVVTAIEGAYVRARAERSGAPFREAGAWIAELV
jgi:TetR/AcrR family transcriptional repressor of lmrAB and yxaGH operons